MTAQRFITLKFYNITRLFILSGESSERNTQIEITTRKQTAERSLFNIYHFHSNIRLPTAEGAGEKNILLFEDDQRSFKCVCGVKDNTVWDYLKNESASASQIDS